jgi:hypothetical protein
VDKNRDRGPVLVNTIMNQRIRGSHSGGYEEFCLLGYNAM